MGIIDKKQMTEEDIKLNFITPAILAKGRQDKITMETQVKFTDGKVNLRGNRISRETPKKADYILYFAKNNPLAVLEAKDNNHSVSFGMQQAKLYAKMLDVPFAYSSNGDAFQEFDFITGVEREIAPDEFPSPEELFARYQNEMNDGQGFSEAERTLIHQPYYTSQNTYPPRYYQQVAVNFQIVYRLLQSGMKQKILYLADRNNLVDQTISGDFKPLEKVIHKINFAKDDRTTITSHQVYFSLYQQLVGNKTTEEETDEETLAHYKQEFNSIKRRLCFIRVLSVALIFVFIILFVILGYFVFPPIL